MKPIISRSIYLCLVICSSNLYAITFSDRLTSNPYNNFYAGAGVGIASLIDKESTNNPISDKHNLSSVGILGDGLIGYDVTVRDQFKMGFEAFINGADLKLVDNQNYKPASSYTIKMLYAAGIRVLPGYELTPGTIVHAILGYANGKFKINDNGDYGLINKQFSKNGFQCGLGLNTPLYKRLAVRADAIYTIYSNQTSDGVTTTTPPGTQAYGNRFSTLEADLSLVYKFIN